MPERRGAFGFDWTDFPWGSEYCAEHGVMMDPDGLEQLRSYDVIHFGAAGWETVPDLSLWGLRLNITQNFDQWANVRPVRFLPGIESPLRKADRTFLDWVVVRKNSEGEYAGLGGRTLSGRGPGNKVAVQTALFTEKGCERIIRFASDLARTRAVRKVSSVTKSNAQQYGSVLWDDVFKRVSTDYPDVQTKSVLVDAMSAKFVLHPEDLSVVAGIGNPVGAIASAALMLGHLGLPAAARRLESAIETDTAAGCRARDVGGTAGTRGVADAVVEALKLSSVPLQAP